MNDSVLVNQVYLIFNRPQFLVDSSDTTYIFQSKAWNQSFIYQYFKFKKHLYFHSKGRTRHLIRITL